MLKSCISPSFKISFEYKIRFIPWYFHFSCDVDKDECLDKPCKNGGRCEQNLEIPGDYTCYCSDEFIGKHCEEVKIKTCDNLPCENGATCTNYLGMLHDNYLS